MMSYQNNIPKLRFSEFDGEWKERRLGEVSNFLDGRRKPIKSDDRSKMKGEYPYYGASGIIDYVNNYIFDEELILLGEDGENIISRNLPLAFRVSGKCWINNHAHVIVPKENTNIDFLTHNLERINYVVYNTGTAQPKLNQEVCRNIPSWFPTLVEQQKIASFLSAVDEKIQQLSRKKELLEQYKKGVMQQLFSGKLRFKDEYGKDYVDWEEKKLGDVGNIITGKTPSTTDSNLWNGDIQFITPTDIKDGIKYQKSTERYVVDNDKIKILPSNSIIYTCIASIGKMCISKFPCITNQQINSLVVHQDCNFEYVYYWLFYITPYIKTTQSNTTLPIINKTDFSKFNISIPCLEEQEKIANFLSNIDTKTESTNQQINQMQSFKKGLLQQLFV